MRCRHFPVSGGCLCGGIHSEKIGVFLQRGICGEAPEGKDRPESGCRRSREFCRAHPRWPESLESSGDRSVRLSGHLLRTQTETIRRFPVYGRPLCGAVVIQSVRLSGHSLRVRTETIRRSPVYGRPLCGAVVIQSIRLSGHLLRTQTETIRRFPVYGRPLCGAVVS